MSASRRPGSRPRPVAGASGLAPAMCRSSPSSVRGSGPSTFGSSRSSTTWRGGSLARLVAVAAIGEHLPGVVTPPAAEHRHDVGLLRHDVLLGDLAVAFDAVDLGGQMGTMAPEHVLGR